MKKIIVLLLLISGLTFSLVLGKIDDLKNKKVVLIIASQNFRDEEFFVTKDYLTKNGVKVVVASSKLKECKGMLGGVVIPQILVSQINVKDFDGVVFIGGSGTGEYFKDQVALSKASEAFKKGKVIGAICIAPAILANAGVLKGKKATAFSSVEYDILKGGAIYTGNLVEVDDKIVTGSGPEAALEFAKALLKLLAK